ncbi:DUF308 domain-containing protein [Staphylococcus xylosus]
MHQSSTIKWSSLIIGVSFLIIGVFIISFPEENLFAITWLIGLLFIINGFLEIFVRQVIKRTAFIVYLFAIWFIINAFFNIFNVTPLEKSNNIFHIISIILNISAILFGIILLFNPLIAAFIIAIFISAVFFIIGISYIIDALN